MFIDRLLNQGNSPLIEQVLRFSAARQRLLAEDFANASTPGYQQKDLSVEKFQHLLRERADQRRTAPVGSVTFGDIMGDETHPANGILFHDGNNRSMEQLVSDSAKNALFHNIMIEVLRKQMGQIESALREKVA